jgi:hypothetical protein
VHIEAEASHKQARLIGRHVEQPILHLLAGVEYRDVHAIDRPDLRKTFKSFSRMRAWFEEHAAGAKGSTRSD